MRNNIYLHPTAHPAGLPVSQSPSTPRSGRRLPALRSNPPPCQSTGFAALDALLPGGGWPANGLIEIVSQQQNLAELQLLMPVLRQRSHQPTSLLWISPPYPLHGPALRQADINVNNSFVIPSQTGCNSALWSIEKALQSQECGMVLAWQNWLSARVMRRLELAAQAGGTLGVVFHQRALHDSPASLQLQIEVPAPSKQGHPQLLVRLLKAGESSRTGEILLPLSERTN